MVWFTMMESTHLADVAELADALVSGTSGSNLVEVQVLSSAPLKTKELLSSFLFGFSMIVA
jgi:hypothetical protein